MILFNGIKKSENIYLLLFSNEDGINVEIPVDQNISMRVLKYLEKIQTPQPKNVEIGNLEDSD